MTTARIFTPEPSSRTGRPSLVACASVATIAVACAVEAGRGDTLYGLFGVPALLFGYAIGRGWAVALPVLLATAAFAVGIECSASETPQALMLSGTAVGVGVRWLADRAGGRR